MRFGRSVPVPDAVGAALELLFEERIGHVRVIEYSLLARLHVSNNATTRRRRIYLRGSAADFFKNPSLMLHEYCHVLKQWEPRTLTVGGYVLESARRGYWNNRFEIEARAFADTHRERLHVMLLGQSQPGETATERPAREPPAGAHDRQVRAGAQALAVTPPDQPSNASRS
jgi:hypothetical protein